jgi:hypothetical protein
MVMLMECRTATEKRGKQVLKKGSRFAGCESEPFFCSKCVLNMGDMPSAGIFSVKHGEALNSNHRNFAGIRCSDSY